MSHPEIIICVCDGEKRIARLFAKFADIIEYEVDGDGNEVERSCFSMSYDEMRNILQAADLATPVALG